MIFLDGRYTMKRKMFMTALILILTGLLPVAGSTATPEESLKKAFPNLKFSSMSPSNIKGIYEVIMPNGILYYAPDAESVLAGEIITKDGRNLTRIKNQEILSARMREKMKDIPLDKAIKIGNGKHIIIEFTDPDCQYCRQAADFFSKRTDVTRYIFFFPLQIHPKATDKVLYVFCAEDKAAVYEEAMTGKLDNMAFKRCEDPQARDLLKVHLELVKRLELKATPFFFVDGQTAVSGADIPQMEKLLADGK
jgi:thiol:disulfide interchange protein DsbC